MKTWSNNNANAKRGTKDTSKRILASFVPSSVALVLLLGFLLRSLLLFRFLLCGLLFSDGFFALETGGSGGLRRFDQLLGGFDVVCVRSLLLFRHCGHQLLEFLKSRNRFRNSSRLSEIRDAELIIRLR